MKPQLNDMRWETLLAATHSQRYAFPSLRSAAGYLAGLSDRPLETCYTALKRYTPGKQVRRLHPHCKRCARIRQILSQSDEQQP